MKIKPSEVNPEPVEVIAQDIASIASAMRTLSNSRLNRKAIVALVHDQSRISKKTIEIVLNNLQDLERDWLKPKQP